MTTLEVNDHPGHRKQAFYENICMWHKNHGSGLIEQFIMTLQILTKNDKNKKLLKNELCKTCPNFMKSNNNNDKKECIEV